MSLDTVSSEKRMVQRLAGLGISLLLWQAAAAVIHSPLLPGAGDVLCAFWPLLLSGELLAHAAVSLRTVLLGFVAACISGIAFGGLLAQFATLRATLTPVVDAIRPVAALSFFPLLILILAVLGSIVFGLATPTEAAAVGAFGGFVLAIAYRQFTFDVLKESVYLTAKTSAMVCWLIVRSAKAAAKLAPPTNSQNTIAPDLAVR